MGLVEVYGKNNCPSCIMLVRWLDENNVRFEYNNVGEYPDLAVELMLRTGNPTLPQFRYEGSWYAGFDIERLRKIFKR